MFDKKVDICKVYGSTKVEKKITEKPQYREKSHHKSKTVTIKRRLDKIGRRIPKKDVLTAEQATYILDQQLGRMLRNRFKSDY